MHRYRRVAWRVALVLFIVSAGTIATLLVNGHRGVPVARAACTQCTGTWYGVANAGFVNSAIASAWPQKPNSNYCSVEDAIAMINFEYFYYGQGTYYGSNDDQVTLGNRNQNATYTADMSGGQPYPGSGTTGWGYGQVQNPPNPYGGRTNIAPDFGADPRSAAWMVWQDTLPNIYFHDHIYNRSMDSTPPATREGEVGRATTLMGRAFEAGYPDPLIAFINGGAHSVLLTGMWSGNDLNTTDIAAIQGLVFRDSEGSVRQEFDYSYWVNGGYVPGYTMWSIFYGDTSVPHDHLNTSDPEPTVGPYATRLPHWYDSLDWVQRDGIYANGAWNPNNAINAVSNSVM